MKYLIMKAILGFGDRLEYLLMCIDFVKQYNLKIYIDWSDKTWNESFYKYFKLDLPTFELNEIDETLSVYPEFWKGQLDKQVSVELILDNNLELNFLKHYNADVIVCTSAGKRKLYSDPKFFSNKFKLIDEKIINEVRIRQKQYNLKDCWCVHLRGTDRFKTKEFKERRFLELQAKLLNNGLLNQKKIILLSDDPEFIKMWTSRFNTPLLSKIMDSDGKGLHNLDISKEEINYNLLIDFFTMMSCKQIFSTSMDSRYVRMAQNLKPYINQIL